MLNLTDVWFDNCVPYMTSYKQHCASIKYNDTSTRIDNFDISFDKTMA